MSTHQLEMFSPSPIVPRAEAYGDIPKPDRLWLRKRNQGVMGAVVKWFEANPGPITAREVAERVGMKLENCVAPRLSELVKQGWLIKCHETVRRGGPVSVHLYRKAEVTR